MSGFLPGLQISAWKFCYRVFFLGLLVIPFFSLCLHANGANEMNTRSEAPTYTTSQETVSFLQRKNRIERIMWENAGALDYCENCNPRSLSIRPMSKKRDFELPFLKHSQAPVRKKVVLDYIVTPDHLSTLLCNGWPYSTLIPYV